MRSKHYIIAGVVVLSAATFSTIAEDERKPEGARTADRRLLAGSAESLQSASKASELIGMEVKNYQGEKLGKVEDLGVETASGRIAAVVISTGGFLGLGDVLNAVPPGSLHHDAANKVVHLDANKEKLLAAPRIEAGNWNETLNLEAVDKLHRHYGAEAAPGRRSEARRELADRDPRRNWDRETGVRRIEKASKLIGMPVKNLQDEKVGDIKDLSVDLAAGRVVAAIVSSGGFLGVGDELNAIPLAAFRAGPDRETLVLDVTKEGLSKAPRFKTGEWPNLGDPTYVRGIHDAYGLDSSHAADADNTKRNKRDRSDAYKTPLDQGNSEPDRNTTIQIRQALTAHDQLSTTAKNVKIITKNGRVLLRGPVNSAAEKDIIEGIAESVATKANVDSQLEVASKRP